MAENKSKKKSIMNEKMLQKVKKLLSDEVLKHPDLELIPECIYRPVAKLQTLSEQCNSDDAVKQPSETEHTTVKTKQK